MDAWQRDDRTYERFQAAARGRSDDPVAIEMADVLDQVVERHLLDHTVTAYRGIRNTSDVFGTLSADIDSLRGRRFSLRGFFATSVFRAVAVEQFTRPPIGGGAALLEVTILSGTRALWVAAAGARELAYQGELLLPSRVVATVTDVDLNSVIPTIRATISTP
ncbi:ADP-ribosyltransferase [Gordonia sp. ABSL11-1]|uniref:ADP-ribosyltransferase n=1 Tax=Gordonia sp. ABSL11-1 TaxID=3053924 RepID=UPI002574652B|nr:ADP-ribosyltransferase [Gordonia sp. ABSL11-1]MDL9948635.1 ADP-ribosyltransferase [Gordonia sp. ABSL11-1]